MRGRASRGTGRRGEFPPSRMTASLVAMRRKAWRGGGLPMRIVVDLNRCQGYAQCVFLAPELFRLGGEEALTYEPNPDDARRLHVERAVAACPVQAIVI